MEEIRKAIPKHCFERNAFTSLGYLSWNVAQSAIIFAAGSLIDVLPQVLPFQSLILWSVYGFVQGVSFTGLWVLAHECGHQSFSEFEWLNNSVGWVRSLMQS